MALATLVKNVLAANKTPLTACRICSELAKQSLKKTTQAEVDSYLHMALAGDN